MADKDKDTSTTKPTLSPRDSLGPAAIFHEKSPSGSMVEIPPPKGLDTGGFKPMPCYCTGEPIKDAGRIVVVFTDVYGIDSGHHKVFADCLAERLAEGGTPTSVLIPDIFRGNPILQPWVKNDNYGKTKDAMGAFLGGPGMMYRVKFGYPIDKVESDIFHMIVPYICDQLGASGCPPVSCVGFGFGGWVVGRILGYNQRQSLQFKCGVGIHPSFQPNLLHGESLPAMAERIHRPILLLPAWNDTDLKPGTAAVESIKSQAKGVTDMLPSIKASRVTDMLPSPPEAATEVMEKVADEYAPDFASGDVSAKSVKAKSVKVQHEEQEPVSIEFPTMTHGWVSRGDPTDPNVAAEQERALQLTVSFIEKHETSPNVEY